MIGIRSRRKQGTMRKPRDLFPTRRHPSSPCHHHYHVSFTSQLACWTACNLVPSPSTSSRTTLPRALNGQYCDFALSPDQTPDPELHLPHLVLTSFSLSFTRCFSCIPHYQPPSCRPVASISLPNLGRPYWTSSTLTQELITGVMARPAIPRLTPSSPCVPF